MSQLPLTWHFIGRLQRNKIRAIATHFSWVHSVSSLAAAQALARHRPADGPRLQICLQVNLDAEVGKDGISPEDTAALAEGVQHLPTLQLRGLMALPAPLAGEEAQYRSLHRLATLAETLRETKGLCLDTLSMGMSEDWVAALRAGSTCIRLGRAIFGARCYTSRL